MRVPALLMPLAAMLVASPALAYVLYLSTSGAPLHWREPAIAIGVAPELPAGLPAEAALAALREGIAAWTAIDCDPPEVSADFDAAAVLNPDDARSSVVWVTDASVWNARFSQLELARTIIIHRVQSGTIVEADIAVNLAGFAFSAGETCAPDRYDLRSMFTHELGHFFGLDHSPVATATMTSRSDPGDCEMRTLDADDVAGFCALYDQPEPPEAEPEPTPEPTPEAEPELVEAEPPHHGRDDGCGTSGGGLMALFALGALRSGRRASSRDRRARSPSRARS